MRYILSELDEQEREESFRLKRFKQLKYKTRPKGRYGDETKRTIDHELLEEEELEPVKPSRKPKKITPLVEPIIPPTPEVPPCGDAAIMQPPIMPPTSKVQPCSCKAITPQPSKVKSIVPPTPSVRECGCAIKTPPPPKVELITPPCMPAPKEEKAEPLITPGNQERLDRLMEHLNQILKIAEELDAAKQTPRVQSFIKCCGDVKGKIKNLSCGLSPSGGPKVCSETPGEVSLAPSICSKPPEKPAAILSTQSVIQSDIFDLEPVTKTTLGEFEKTFEEKITVTRTKNRDGSIREEKQIITIQTETRTPRPEKYGGGAMSPCGTCGGEGEYSGGKRGGRGRGGKKRSATRTPSWSTKLSACRTPSRTSKFSGSRSPSCGCKTRGARTSTSVCNDSQEPSAFFSYNTSRVPSDSCCTQAASKLSETSKTLSGCAKPSETFKPYGTPKSSEHSIPCVASKVSETARPCEIPNTSVTLKPCGSSKSNEAPRPNITLKPCGCSEPSFTSEPRGTPEPSVTLPPCSCPDTVPSYASVIRQPSATVTCGSSYYSTTASYLDSTSNPFTRNEQSSCVSSPNRPKINKSASNTCSCSTVPVSEKKSEESRDPLNTKPSFKSESNSAYFFVEKLSEMPVQKPHSEDKSTYCIPNCGNILMSKSAGTQSKCLFALASPSASTTNDSLNRSKASQSDCTRTSSNTLDASIDDDSIVVRGSRLNALRKMILPSINSEDYHISGVATVSNLSSYTCLCTSPQTSALSTRNSKAPFQRNPKCLTCLANEETEVESDLDDTHDKNSCVSQSASFKIPQEAASGVLAECRAAVAALAEHINRTAGLLSPVSSNIWYSTFGTPKQKDAMTSSTSYRSDSNQIEALCNDQGHESVYQLPTSSITDTYLEIEQNQDDFVHKVSSSSSSI